MADNRIKLAEYVSRVEADASLELLIKPETGELWEVDAGELHNRGVPQRLGTVF